MMRIEGISGGFGKEGRGFRIVIVGWKRKSDF